MGSKIGTPSPPDLRTIPPLTERPWLDGCMMARPSGPNRWLPTGDRMIGPEHVAALRQSLRGLSWLITPLWDIVIQAAVDSAILWTRTRSIFTDGYFHLPQA